jgi:hypothetical protein
MVVLHTHQVVHTLVAVDHNPEVVGHTVPIIEKYLAILSATCQSILLNLLFTVLTKWLHLTIPRQSNNRYLGNQWQAWLKAGMQCSLEVIADVHC